jgi:shikimate dehydrogenase
MSMREQRISGSTRLVGLLGWPVAHSVSPTLHNHLFRHYGCDLAYVPLPVAPADLHTAIHALRACGFAGANVTIPHKRAVLPYCDRVSELSERIGAVNTLWLRDGLLWGTTTDPAGFRRALAWMGHDPKAGHCVILGNGGTARTLAFALALERLPASLTLVGRNAARVEALAREVEAGSGGVVRAVALDSPDLAPVMQQCTLLVNCTSVGMHPDVAATPLPKRFLNERMTVVDAVYNPAETVFVREARAAGCRVQNGLRMLVYQAFESFTHWTGVEVDEHVVDFDELQATLAGQQQRP